ncbi:hypothetical protein [Sanyastnella coralliicola]|uniref:hypothetical protein n=1 Tax=Sanyastnella coralliicola TaxID=3069118 RepID=UPI0027BA0B48|nr:hypothetical protein [Longitalea sp. SCSIO 12813]
MKIEIDKNQIIDLEDFELNWRWKESHSSTILATEKAQIKPVSEKESERLNEMIAYFENEDNLRTAFHQTGWFSAKCDSDEDSSNFRNKLRSILEAYNEDVIVTWNRSTTLKTSKEIFIKYWDDFCYPSSDDITVISEETNWVLFYRHFEAVNVWTK